MMTLGLLKLMYALFIVIPGGAAATAGFWDERSGYSHRADKKPPAYGGLMVPNAIVAIWGVICSLFVLMANPGGLGYAGPVFWFSLVTGIVSSVWLVGTFLFVSPQVREALQSLSLPKRSKKSPKETPITEHEIL